MKGDEQRGKGKFLSDTLLKKFLSSTQNIHTVYVYIMYTVYTNIYIYSIYTVYIYIYMYI